MTRKGVDKFFLGIIISLLIIGIFSFGSASLGVLVKSSSKFYSVLFNQIVLGFGAGILGLIICLKLDYKFWKKYSFYIFLASIFITLLVFIPGLGKEHSGAQRWISIGPVSFQPVEFLKLAFLIYFAAWLSWIKNKVHDFKFGILPFLIMIGIIAVLLLKQPDTKSFILIFIASVSMLFISGIKWKYIIFMILATIIGLLILVSFKPYLADRLKTFLDPNRDPAGSSYQLQQSLIAVGSGGMFGRGLGQGIQKFSYLPEPQGDSIFAVIGEEFGFLGGVIVIILFLMFTLRGLRIANRSPDLFSRLLVTGIVILIIAQSFLNIASTIGVLPLTGVTLVFISHGGTSLFFSLIAVGIILSISRHQKRA